MGVDGVLGGSCDAAARLDRVGCFPYSPVEGAAANALPEPVRRERWDRFMERAAAIGAERLPENVGTRTTVLVDAVEDGLAVGRGPADAPEIDGGVRVAGLARPAAAVGELVAVEVTGADTYDLDARALTG